MCARQRLERASFAAAMLHLHVWGPAFGLPSIDAECLAAIAYLAHACPRSAWCLVASNDAAASPSRHLPALRHDGVCVSGFRRIVDYLAAGALGRSLDAGLDAAGRADAVAYAAYLAAHAAPLLDLSLYVSAANWSAATRPAYGALLPFPLTWTVPPLVRAEAAERARHLGLADLDADFDPGAGLHLSAGRDALPETVRRHLPATARRTVRGEMTPEQAAAIRLHALVGDCLSDLAAWLDRHGQRDPEQPRFFAATPVTSLDCLAYGYLALMLEPRLPRPFLRDWILAEAPQLGQFVAGMTPRDLPWAAPAPPPTAAGAGARLADSVLRNAPGLGGLYAREMRLRAERGARGLDSRALVLASGLLAAGAAVGYGLYAYKSLQPLGAPSQVWRATRGRSALSQFGELGIMLSGAMGALGSMPVTSGLSPDEAGLAEVDLEVD